MTEKTVIVYNGR